MRNKITNFFDKLEDKIRGRLSHFPLLYAFLGGVGVVLFWRGVWHTTDFITGILLGTSEFSLAGFLDGPLSLVIGSVLLLITGVFVSAFIGSRLIISGLSGEKKLTEKTEKEILSEESEIKSLKKTLDGMEEKIEEIESEIKHHHK